MNPPAGEHEHRSGQGGPGPATVGGSHCRPWGPPATLPASGVMARRGKGGAAALRPGPCPLSCAPWHHLPECRPVGRETALQRAAGAHPPSTPTTPRKPVDAMTSEEVARRREQDLSRHDVDSSLPWAEQRRRRLAREAYEDAAHNHGHYGEAAH